MEDQVATLARVSVETLLLRANALGRWAYRRLLTSPRPGESPDEAARRVCGVPADARHTIMHSTSWRYRPEGQIVLTYAVCPDPAPGSAAVELPGLRVATGGAPAAPTPGDLRVEHVVAHAIRHLAFLKNTDPVVGEVLARSPEIGLALDGVPPSPAGG